MPRQRIAQHLINSVIQQNPHVLCFSPTRIRPELCYHPEMADANTPRHSYLVRLTHWLTVLCFFALLVTGVEILISHPRFYWGETGNALMKPLFVIPIPASRATVPTGYNFVLPDQNGWSRYLHFQAAWAVVFTGLVYLVSGLVTRHFRRNLLPEPGQLSVRAIAAVVSKHLRFEKPTHADAASYNVLQRLTYLAVIFIAFPLTVWTGLAMSPAIVAVFPFTVTVFGGQQSARTLHFFLTLFLVAFLALHVAMVWLAGFRKTLRAMLTGDSK